MSDPTLLKVIDVLLVEDDDGDVLMTREAFEHYKIHNRLHVVRIVSRVVRGHDLYEGIRAVIVDKDQAPRWQPATLEAVDERQVERHFDPVENELQVP